MDKILEFKDVTKSFFGVKALENISFELNKGHILGLIGENGAGKSTLMNILAGVIDFNKGKIIFDGTNYKPENAGDAFAAGITFIHQELNLFPNLSIAENIFIDNFPGKNLINKREMNQRASKLLERLNVNISPKTQVKKLTAGERQLVEIAKSLRFDAKLIIFDEPATSLTAREKEVLFKTIEKLNNEDKSIIYISHDLEDVANLADDIVVLRDGQLIDKGPIAEFTIDDMITRMVGGTLEQMYPERTSEPSSEVVLGVKSVSQPGIVANINFQLHKQEILGLFGLMGSGRSELARILFGLDPYQQGEIILDGKRLERYSPRERINHNMAFVTEDRHEDGLLMEASLYDNIGLISLPYYSQSQIINQDKLHASIEEVVARLNVKYDTLDNQPAKSLSGGNQQKIIIGKWLLLEPSVCILDEATRGIDVGAKTEVYKIIVNLAGQGSGVLFISSEIEELMGVCDRILVMSNGEILDEFLRSEFDQEKIIRAAFGQGREDVV